MLERLELIVEKYYPIYPKDCRIRRAAQTDKRKMRIGRLIRELDGLTDEQKEQKIKQWEDESAGSQDI